MNDNVKAIYTVGLGTKMPERILITPDTKIYYMADILEAQKNQVYTREFFKGLWCVYILELNDGSLYTGITNNLSERLKTHASGRGSKYVRSRLPMSLIYIELSDDRSTASKLEYHIKSLSKSDKHRARILAKENTLLLSCNCGLLLRIKTDTIIDKQLTCLACNSTIYIAEEFKEE